MYSTKLPSRARKGSVKVFSSNGRLQLRFSYGGKRHYVSTGYPDEPQYRQMAEIKAKEIEKDILFERLDPSDLSKYKPKALDKGFTPITSPTVSEVALSGLWEQYTAFKRPSLSPSTIAKDYARVANCIENDLPTQSLNRAIAIRDWLVANKPPNAAKRYLTQFSACCKWAVKSQLIENNPFAGMAADIKIPKAESEETDINPFTLAERDLIIEQFKMDPNYGFYAKFIEFLFLTGCRPSEGVALQWKHISQDCCSIHFKQAVVISEDGLVCKEGLKTQKRRIFPANAKLMALLKEIRPDNRSKEDKVFPSPHGTWIDVHNLSNRGWKVVLSQLETIEYRNLYQTRHTFITAALETPITMPDGTTRLLDAKDVAKLVGNSPETIYRHYAGASRHLTVPEF
ncbi:DUF3596 domain-containing protein [Nodosilinea sp. LEGE 07088]|uniref:Arm DNA-binding domain-containing protein n=1 Tax=Nodosilinea sp. LEGE 07088 TaxID=2777968 RepID=UPI00187F8148|nr:DUF3596 domain-containing protein [Nodosilinea sp. LEGE 07088]MBE9138747.1 DUF3596 domain-containing protein [Nodosilinea sp. LEGE 07088]